MVRKDGLTTLVGVLSQVFLLVTAAGAVEINDYQNESVNEFVLANIDWDLTDANGIDETGLIVAQNDDTETEFNADEEFYFGPDEDKVRAEMEKNKVALDPIARAHRDMKLYIGIGLIATAATMFVLGMIHTERELPKDYYQGKKKYDEVYGEDNPVPLVTVKEPYVPSLAAGIGLAAGSVFLMLKK